MAAMYQSRIASVDRCGDFLAVSIERPDGYAFSAGQWLRMTIETEEGEQTRTLSHAGGPADAALQVGTRLSTSVFKRALADAVPGASVKLSGPGGRPPSLDLGRVAFLTGGVGITPVRSIVRDAMARGTDLTGSTLFFGNRDASCIPYVAELGEWGDAGLQIIHVLETVGPDFAAESGFITAEIVSRHVSPDEAVFYVAGPPVMVGVMERLLDDLGVSEQRRHIEAFGR